MSAIILLHHLVVLLLVLGVASVGNAVACYDVVTASLVINRRATHYCSSMILQVQLVNMQPMNPFILGRMWLLDRLINQ